jgi:hypothetical protein
MAPPKVPLDVRFEKWTRKTETGCWEWLGKRDRKGYAHIKHDGRDRKAATVAYEWKNGPVPKGLEISHTCPHGGLFARCVNPDHLVAETHSANLKRRRPFSRFRGNLCKRGHPLPPMEKRNKNGSCPECFAEYQAKWKTENPGYNAAYREANKDRINAQRRLRRSRTMT